MKRTTDRRAIALAILILAILWFLRGNMGGKKAGNIGGKMGKKAAIQKDLVAPTPNVKVEEKKADIKVEPKEAPAKIEAEVKKAEVKAPEPKKEEVKVEPKAEPEAAALPAWFTYLQSENYTDSDAKAIKGMKTLDTFKGDQLVTRSSSTPFLTRYGDLAKLPAKSPDAECTFPDVTNKSESLQASIKKACNLDILRGSNGKFIPDRLMTKDELLTVLVRTRTGFLDESATPWFKNYFEYAQKNNLIDSTMKIADFRGNVSKKELGERLYNISLVK